MNQIITLKIQIGNNGEEQDIYPVVLCDDNYGVLVDCGGTGSLSQIEEALLKAGVSPERITHMILTHQDHDHVGAAAAFKRRYQKVIIMSSEEESPYISGEEKSLRLEQAETFQKLLPQEQQEWGEAFCNLLRSIEPVAVEHFLREGDKLPFCGECLVLETPGHTPGHISLYVTKFDTVIAGDAMVLEEGRPMVANPQFALDIDRAEESFQRLRSFPAKQIICYHGGIYHTGK